MLKKPFSLQKGFLLAVTRCLPDEAGVGIFFARLVNKKVLLC